MGPGLMRESLGDRGYGMVCNIVHRRLRRVKADTSMDCTKD